MWVHLSIAGHHDRDIRLELDRPAMSGEDGSADTEVPLVTDDLDAGVSNLARSRRCRVGTSVIDDEDVVDVRGHRSDRRSDEGLFVVCRNDDRDAPILIHRRPFGPGNAR